MALITLLSASGAPGVSTTAIGLAMAWPRPVLLVEAAPTGSALLPGRFRGQMDASRGVQQAAVAHRYGQLLTELSSHTIWLDTVGRVSCLLGYTDPPAQGPNLASFWPALAEACDDLERNGMDVLVDAGRVGAADSPHALIEKAEALLLVTNSSMASVAAARPWAAKFVADRAASGGADTVGLAIVGPGRPFKSSNVADKGVQLPLWFEVAYDPEHAAVYSDGTKATKRFENSAFARSMVTGAEQITRRVAARRQRLVRRAR